jgi:hypothetical protein
MDDPLIGVRHTAMVQCNRRSPLLPADCGLMAVM